MRDRIRSWGSQKSLESCQSGSLDAAEGKGKCLFIRTGMPALVAEAPVIRPIRKGKECSHKGRADSNSGVV